MFPLDIVALSTLVYAVRVQGNQAATLVLSISRAWPRNKHFWNPAVFLMASGGFIEPHQPPRTRATRLQMAGTVRDYTLLPTSNVLICLLRLTKLARLPIPRHKNL